MTVVLAVTVSTITACTGSGPTAVNSVQVRSGESAFLETSDGSLGIQLPSSSFIGDGTLTVSEVEDGGISQSWSIELTQGAELTGEAILTFKHVGEISGQTPPLITSTQRGGQPVAVEDQTFSGSTAVVRTNHFSEWHIMWFEDLMEKLRAELNRIYSDLGKQPICKGEAELKQLGYQTDSDPGNRVKWCFGIRDETPTLDLVNSRGYFVAAESAPGATVVGGGPTDFVSFIANLVKENPSKRGNIVTLVPPGAHAVYTIGDVTTTGVKISPSVAGYLVSAAQFAVETLALVLPAVGKAGLTNAAIQDLFDWGGCLAGFTSMATSSMETATQASNYFNDAVATTLGCLGPALGKAGLNFAGLALAASLAWLVSGVRTAAGGLGAAVETALDPDGYQVVISAKADATDVSKWVIGFGTLGPLSAGMSMSDMAAVMRVPMSGNQWGSGMDDFDGYCAQGSLEENGVASHIGFLAESGGSYGPIDSFYLNGYGANLHNFPVTIGGTGIGSTESDVRAEFGRGVVQDLHPYVEGGKLLSILGPNETAIAFYTDATGTVTEVSTGRVPQVFFPEGCA